MKIQECSSVGESCGLINHVSHRFKSYHSYFSCLLFFRNFGVPPFYPVGVTVNGGARPTAGIYKIFLTKKFRNSYIMEVEVLKVKCISKYYDRVLKKIIEVDQVIDATEERANQLITAKVATPTTEEKVVKKRASKKVEDNEQQA